MGALPENPPPAAPQPEETSANEATPRPHGLPQNPRPEVQNATAPQDPRPEVQNAPAPQVARALTQRVTRRQTATRQERSGQNGVNRLAPLAPRGRRRGAMDQTGQRSTRQNGPAGGPPTRPTGAAPGRQQTDQLATDQVNGRGRNRRGRQRNSLDNRPPWRI